MDSYSHMKESSSDPVNLKNRSRDDMEDEMNKTKKIYLERTSDEDKKSGDKYLKGSLVGPSRWGTNLKGKNLFWDDVDLGDDSAPIDAVLYYEEVIIPYLEGKSGPTGYNWKGKAVKDDRTDDERMRDLRGAESFLLEAGMPSDEEINGWLIC